MKHCGKHHVKANKRRARYKGLFTDYYLIAAGGVSQSISAFFLLRIAQSGGWFFELRVSALNQGWIVTVVR